MKKPVAFCDSHTCLELERFNFISHLASYRNWDTSMATVGFMVELSNPSFSIVKKK